MSAKASFRNARTLIPESEQGIYTGQLNPTNPDRLYRLRLSQARSLNLVLDGLKSNVDLLLLNNENQVIDRSNRRGRNAEAIDRVVEPGLYFIKVVARGLAQLAQLGATRYRLEVTQTEPEVTRKTPIVSVSNPLIEQVLALTNDYRQAAGMAPLRFNPALAAAAQAHSEDMAFNDYFSHTGLNGSSISDRVKAAGYRPFLSTENIAAGYSSPNSVFQAWINSPGHRDNILNPTLEEIGIGFYFLETDPGNLPYQYYWTQNFGIAIA